MYIVAVKIEGIESRRRSAGLMHLLIGFYLFIKAAGYQSDLRVAHAILIYPVYAVAILSLGYGFFRKQFDKRNAYNVAFRVLEIGALLTLGVLMANLGRTLDAVTLFVWVPLGVLLMISEKRVFKETTLLFEEHGIKIPGYYKDHLVPWAQLAEVVVREDFVTIFHSRKKYLQYQVMQDLSTLEVAKMNSFCKEKIEQVTSVTSSNQ